jgi:hypothetical protein
MIRISTIRSLSLGFLLLGGLPLAAREWWVSPTGDDGSAGTKGAPWGTLAKANGEVQAGDTVTLLAGRHEGMIAPKLSGEAGKRIVYRAAEPWAAVVVGKKGTSDPLVVLGRRNHVSVADLTLDGEAKHNWFALDKSHHIAISGCTMRRARRTAQATYCEQLRLVDNVFRCDQVGGNMLVLRECSYVLFEGNNLSRVGHSPLQITTCRNVIVRANCFRNPWGRNYEFWASGRLLIEDNIVTQARDSGHSADSRAKNLYIDGIYRHNRIFGNLHTPLNSGPYMPMGAKPTSYFREPFRLLNSRIYGNVIADNLGNGWQFAGVNISLNVFCNNILAGNDWTANGTQLMVSDRISRDNRFLNNLLAGREPDGAVVQYGDSYLTVPEVEKRTPVLRGFWTEFGGNVSDVPAFRNRANQDYRLAPASPGVDAGRHLALAVGKGTGRVLPVTDGIPFSDGLGVEGEKGDWIAVAKPEQTARIERVELRYCQPALLHLDREVTWGNGEPVSLPWTGKAPDMGAYEVGLKHPTRFAVFATSAQVGPGQPVRFTVDALGRKIETILWRFGDGGISTQVAPEHTYQGIGQHGVVCRAEFANGESSVAVVFVDVATPTDASTPLVDANFEADTRDTHWGHYFKFYRKRLTGYEWVEREDGKGRCMRLFADAKKSNSVAGCLAPGAWDIEAYPYVRFSYRIPKGTPVGLCVEPFAAPKLPRRVLLGGTAARSKADSRVGRDTGTLALIDDGAWHTATVDVRAVREAIPNLRYLRVVQFHCYWPRASTYEFRFDDFAILPADARP